METYQTEGIKLQMLKLSQDSSDSDWERLNANLGRIKSTAESVSSYAWLAPAVVSCTVPNSSAGWKMINSVEDATAKLTQRMDQTVKFLDVVGKMNDGLTMYVEAKQVFQGDKRMGVAFAGLSLTLTFCPRARWVLRGNCKADSGTCYPLEGIYYGLYCGNVTG